MIFQDVAFSSAFAFLFFCLLSLVGVVGSVDVEPVNEAYTITPLDRAFNDWFRSITEGYGGSVNQVEIRTTESMGRGVYALKTVPGETPLLKIPRDYIISVGTVENSESAFVYKRMEKDSDKLTLFILEQNAKGPASKFKPWLDVMPREFGSPFFATERELELLKGDPMYVEVVEELKLWERQYDLLSASVLEKFPEIFPEGCCSFQEYKWARHMIESRAWHLRGKQHLAPMADFFNHEPLPSMTYDTEPDERGEAFLAHHHVAPAYVEVLADRTHAEGGQVFECYGDNSNSIYFKYHGFVPNENQYDCQDVILPALTPQAEDPLYQHRIRYLSMLGFRSPKFCVRKRDDHFRKALNFVNVRSMTSDDFFECESKDFASIPLAERLERCILRPIPMEPLVSVLQERLDSYPTSLAQDLQTLNENSSTLTQIERWSIMYVSKRKEILQALMNFITAHDATTQGHVSSGGKKKKKKSRSASHDEEL